MKYAHTTTGGMIMQITNGVQLHFMKTEKFKDIGISIRFRSVIDVKRMIQRKR